jgi:ABC-type branched-subunit amino acid transport system substrate-binding protein
MVPYIDYEALLKKVDCDVLKYTWTTSRITSYLIMLQAIERAGTLDRTKVRDTLAKSTFNTPIGLVYFKEDGLARNPGFPGQWRQGKFAIVGPPQAATGKIVYPRPSWDQIGS